MVFLDKQDCISKTGNILEQWDTSGNVSTKPTKKRKNKLINLLKTLK